MAPMGFLVDVQLFNFAQERLFFIAKQGAKLVGFLSAVSIYARDGWLFEDLMRSHDHPMAPSSLSSTPACRKLRCASHACLTLGMALLVAAVPRRLGWLRELTRPFYDFTGVLRSRQSLVRVRGLFLLVPTENSHTRALLNSLRDFYWRQLRGVSAFRRW